MNIKNEILIIVFWVITSSMLMGQNVIEKKFYKNRFGGPPVDENQAKVVELIIQEPDSILRYEMRSIKKNKLLRLRFYRNDEPVGKWILLNGTEVDYGYNLIYANAEYSNIIIYDIYSKKTRNPVDGNFEPPVFLNGNDFSSFFLNNLRYPQQAAENGIQGKVISQFIIDEEGKANNFSILQSAGKELDKEVARLINLCSAWKPAKLNGTPVRVCIIMPTNFKLEG